MKLRDLFLRVRALVARRRVERELDEELSFHIERETQKQIAAGLSPVDARTRALARFGSVPLAADGCRDARRTAFVDDLGRDIRYALRAFRRAPLAAATIVATVALGLGLVAVVFTVYDVLLLRVDAVRNPGELFAVELERSGGGTDDDLFLARPDYEAMRRETSAFTDSVARLDFNLTRLDGRPAITDLVTGNFFQVLGVQAALGRPLLPQDDELSGGRPVIVLSHTGWRKLFREDSAVIGRAVTIDDAPYQIVGVMPDGFRGLGLTPPDFWAPLSLDGQFRTKSGVRKNRETSAIEVIGRLKPGRSRDSAAAELSAWASGRADLTPLNRPIHVSLTPRQGTLSEGVLWWHLAFFPPLFFAFGLILTIGCANVANLLLARGVSRQREIGIRLSLGASRRRIIRQLLTESLILSLAAAACGLVVSWVFLASAHYAVMTTLPPEIAWFVNLFNVAAPVPDWRVVVFLIAGAVASTGFVGLAPALHATRFDLVRTMRGELMRNARPGRARGVLIAVQVGASALLLICAAIFLRGAFAAETNNLGIRTSDTVTARVSVENEPRRAALLQELEAHPLVMAVAARSNPTAAVIETSNSSSVPVDQVAVSSGYFDLLGIDVVSGRGFMHAERTPEAGVMIVSETIVRQLWPNADGVGQLVLLHAPRSASPDGRPMSSRTFTVVGIVRDPSRDSAFYLGGVYLPTVPESPATRLYLRVRGNPEQARQALERLTSVDWAPFDIFTLRTMARWQTYGLQIAFSLALVLGGLALILTVSGLFSVLSYIVEQQAKEISVRMALGAATTNVVRFVLSQSFRPVGIGLAAGGGLASALAIVLLTTPVAAEIPTTIHVLDPIAYAASVLVIVTSCALAVSVPALRAARINPMTTLRKE